MIDQAHHGDRGEGQPTSDPGEIWQEVDAIMASHGSTSATRSLWRIVEARGPGIRSIAVAARASYSSQGVGEDVRLEAASLTGSVLVVDDRPIHAVLYSLGSG